MVTQGGTVALSGRSVDNLLSASKIDQYGLLDASNFNGAGGRVILDADAVRILHGEDSKELAQNVTFTNDIAARTATAIQSTIRQLKPVTHVVGTKAKVVNVASNRRVPQPDGSIAVRASLTRELDVRDAPEGLIDLGQRLVRQANQSAFRGDPQTTKNGARQLP